MTEQTERRLSLGFLIALILWGGYSTLSYLGVPLHDLVLVNETTLNQLAELCPGNGLVCRGLWTIPSAVAFLLSVRIQPLFWFIFWSAVFYGGFLFWRALKTGEWRVTGPLKVWHLLLLFLATIWLLFSVLSRSLGSEQNPMRILYEPLPQVYTQATQAELTVLTQNKNDLLERGCLSELGMTPHGAKVFQLREFCVQSAFFTRVLPPLLFLVLFVIECLLLGSLLLRLLKADIRTPLLHSLFSVGLGAGAWTVLLWTLAQVSLYKAGFGWALFVIIPLLCFREAKGWWQQIRGASVHIDFSWRSGRVFFLWALLTLLALNFLYVIRPFPIGWDDLGRYLNQPRLLVSYGAAIPTMGTFQWEYITSLGFLLFGYDSTVAATIAMQLNWLAGLFAVATVYAFGRAILGPGGGVLSALLYYITPVIGHFSFADMKTDNAVFAMGTLALLSALLWLLPSLQTDDDHDDSAESEFGDYRLLVLAGVFTGLAFGFKATAIMVGMTIGALLLRGTLRRWGLFGACLLIFTVFAQQGNLNIAKLSDRVFGDPAAIPKTALISILAVLGIASLAWGAFRNREHLRIATKAVAVFLVSFFVMILPWMIVNSMKSGAVIPGLRFAPPNTLSARFELSDASPVDGEGLVVRKLPKELQVDLQNPACVSSGGTEELDRYWGYSEGWSHYLKLPWRAVMDSDSGGYYVTELPGFLLLPLLLLLPVFWTRKGRGIAMLFWATVLLVLQWMFLANGVPWYGIGMFLGLAMAMEVLVRRSPTRSSHAVAWVLVIVSLCVGLAMRMWQLDQQRSLFEYAMGKVSSEVLRERTIPFYDKIRDRVLASAAQNPDAPYVYRMGTFIPYFIPKNLEYLPIADNQLDTFNCINQERNHPLTLRRLQALGFNSLIFDTNTATIEKDPNGSLHKKVNMLIDFLNDPAVPVNPVFNDPDAGLIYVQFPPQ